LMLICCVVGGVSVGVAVGVWVVVVDVDVVSVEACVLF